MDLIWIDGVLLVAGPDTKPWTGPGIVRPAAGLRFASGVGPAILGVPAAELRNARVPLIDLWPSAVVRCWEDRLARPPVAEPGEPDEPADLDGPVCLSQLAELGATLEALARTVVPGAAAVEPVRQVARWCASGRSVRDITEATGWSERTLHRRCRHSFGYGANTLSRILRFRRATGWITGGLPLAEVAARAGYADQAHLSREVKEFAGRSPTTFRAG